MTYACINEEWRAWASYYLLCAHNLALVFRFSPTLAEFSPKSEIPPYYCALELRILFFHSL
jgi:hypothetical protein